MIILGIETSCDETAAAVCRNGCEVLSSIVLSQTEEHARYGGVVPEIASRMHIENIHQLVNRAVREAGMNKNEIDAVAATYAPGLIGALLVGLNFAKSAAYALGCPFVPVHHIRAHIAANYIACPSLTPPFVCLVASGGHTLFLHVKDYTDIQKLGSTRDDAAGEAFDKVARVLSLGYPGGRVLDELSRTGREDAYILPRPELDGTPFDCSFSGLKTAVINLVHNTAQKGETLNLPDLAASFSRAVTDMLSSRLLLAEKQLRTGKIVLSGGVAANSMLRETLQRLAKQEQVELFMPPPELCGDNAAMVAVQGYYELGKQTSWHLSQNAYATGSAD